MVSNYFNLKLTPFAICQGKMSIYLELLKYTSSHTLSQNHIIPYLCDVIYESSLYMSPVSPVFHTVVTVRIGLKNSIILFTSNIKFSNMID